MQDLELKYAAQIVGWIYLVCWTVGYYPQIYLNCRRKSVVGLSFDMTCMDFLGCLAYVLYTITLYCDAALQKYFHSFEHQHFNDQDNTVKLTDVVFASHGFVMACIVVLQIICYEKGTQRLSKITAGLCSLTSLVFVVLVIIAATEKSHSLSSLALALMYAGYVKSGISFIRVSTQKLLILFICMTLWKTGSNHFTEEKPVFDFRLWIGSKNRRKS